MSCFVYVCFFFMIILQGESISPFMFSRDSIKNLPFLMNRQEKIHKFPNFCSF